MTPARIDHIGIIVEDLDAAIARFRVLLGTEPVRRDMPDVGLSIAEFRTANVGIELIAYAGEAEFARRVMGEEAGLNHIAVSVADVEAEARRLRPEGLEPQPGFPRAGAHGEVLFFERDPETGLLLEICRPDPDPHSEDM